MTRPWFFLPVSLLVTFAAYLGLRAGYVPTETEIINRYAALYVSDTGGGAQLTDCAATPHPDPAIRMQVICQPVEGEPVTFLVELRGRLVEPQNQGAGT